MGTEFPREVGPPDRKFGGTEFPVTPANYLQHTCYIAFDAESSRQLMKAMGDSDSIEIRAEFELPHRYFDSLHEALDALP